MTKTLVQKLEESVSFLKKKIDEKVTPEIMVVLGSGYYGFSKSVDKIVTIEQTEIPHLLCPKVAGHGRTLEVGTVGGRKVAVLTGRIHMYEGYSANDVVYAVRMMAKFGVKKLLLTNAAGGLNPKLKAGDVVALKDHINLSGQNCLAGEASGLGVQFIDMMNAYDKEWREKILKNKEVREGVYASVLGPTYETPAETKMIAGLGADVVGMSTVQETIAARQLGMKVACLSFVSNMACGISHNVNHAEVLQMGRDRGKFLETVLREAVEAAP